MAHGAAHRHTQSNALHALMALRRPHASRLTPRRDRFLFQRRTNLPAGIERRPGTMASTAIKAPGSAGRVMLAYSGGLDTSCILAWLVEQVRPRATGPAGSA